MNRALKLLFPFLLIVFAFSVKAQNTFYSQGSTAPNTASNWNTVRLGGGTAAVASDFTNGSTFIVQNAHAMVTTATWTLSTGTTLQIESGGSLQASHNIDLSGDGIFLLDDGGTYIHNHTGSFNSGIFSAATITIGTISSTVQVSANATITSNAYANLTITNSATVTVTGGIMTIENVLTINSGSTLNMVTNRLLDGASFSTSGTGTLRTQRTTTIIPAGYAWTFTVRYDAAGSQTIVAGDYSNINATNGNRTLATSTIKISGTFTPGAGAYTITGSTIEYNGTSSQNVAGFTYNNLTISNTSAIASATGAITVNSVLEVSSSAILDMGTNAILGASLTTLGTGTIRTQRTATAIPSGRTWSQTIEYNASSGAQSVIDGTYASLSLSNSSGTQTAAGAITVTSNLTVASGGTFDLGVNQLSTVGGTIAGTGTISTQRTTTAIPSSRTWSQTVNYNAASGGQSIISGTYASLSLSNSSGTQTVSSSLTVTNNLTIASGATLNMVTFDLIGLAGTISGTGTLATQETSATPIPSGKTWSGSVLFNGSLAQTTPSGTYNNLSITNTGATVSAGGNLTVNGTLNIPSSVVFDLVTNTLAGTLSSITGAGTISSQNTSVSPLSSGKTWTQTIEYNATSGTQSIVSGTYANLTASNTSGTNTLTGSVTVTGAFSASGASSIFAINGNTLTLQGSVSLAGNFTGSSTSNLTISGTTGSSPTIRFNAAANDSLLNTLTLNRTGGSAGVTLASNVAITNLLLISNGDFNLNGRIVTLKSTSIANTAQVGTVGGTITYGGGTFTVERFIPTGNRAYRDIAPGVNTASNVYFYETWQESGGSTANLGTHITGLIGVSPGGVDATTGLDITNNGGKSLFTYVNGVWSTGVTNTKTTKPDLYQGYRLFIRGDRTFALYAPPGGGMPTNTKLRTTGQLVHGNVTYTTSGITNAVLNSSYTLNTTTTAGSYSFIANPYYAAVNWNSGSMTRTNLLGTYTVWDPTLSSGGAYVTYNGVTNSNGASSVNQYIQPGQSFFVEASGAGSPTLVITEATKATGVGLTTVFRNSASVNKLAFTLSKFITSLNQTRNVDGNVVVFDATYTNEVTAKDANKFTNGTENIAVNRGTKNISIEERSLPTIVDTIPLKIWQVVNGTNYTLTINAQEFTSPLSAYLLDKFTNTEKLLKVADTTNISFTASTANIATYDNRFFVVFRSNNALPLSTISVSAVAKANGVEVNFTTTNEVQVQSFEIERASDVITFNKIGTVVAKNETSNQYSLLDATAKKGVWYYRIKVINMDGSFKYSNTVAINLNGGNEQITLYPNPVKGNSFTVQLNNIEKGNYTLSMFNSMGQKVLNKNIVQANGVINNSVVVDWNSGVMPSGNYTIILQNNAGLKIVKSIIIE